MPLAPIPKTAPFAEEEIEALNRIVGPATPTQRAWLAGFLAGLEASEASGAVPHAEPAAAPVPAEPLTILYATESGNAEKLAGDLAKVARKNGLKPTLVDMADLELASLASWRRLVVIASTWGEGEPPARAARGYTDLMSEAAPRLDRVEFGVLALGDTAYAEFCAIGKAIDERLAALGAKRVADRVDCDLDFGEPAAKWIDDAVKVLAPPQPARSTVIAVDFGAKPAGAPEAGPLDAEITEHINLNSSRSAKTTIHLELAFNGAAPPYKPGDSLDIYPENDPAYVEALLKVAGLSGEGALRGEFIKSRDVTTLSLKTVYQTVHDLEALGEVHVLDLGTGSVRVDPNVEDEHHHLVCTSCGQVRDLPVAYDDLHVPARWRRGFTVDDVVVIFQGRCEDCSQ